MITRLVLLIDSYNKAVHNIYIYIYIYIYIHIVPKLEIPFVQHNVNWIHSLTTTTRTKRDTHSANDCFS